MTPDQLQTMLDQIDPAAVNQIAAQLGIDPMTAGEIVNRAVPAMMAGMAGNAQSALGADLLNGALDADHDGSILDDLVGYLGKADTTTGGAILGHVFGGKESAIVKEIATRLGLDPSTVSAALAMLAPIIMGQLGKQRQQGGFDAGQLAGLMPAIQDMLGAGGLAELLGGAGRGAS